MPCRNVGVRCSVLDGTEGGIASIYGPPAVLTLSIFYVTHAKAHPERGLPQLTLATVFEVVIDARVVYHVEGRTLQRWIVNQREKLKGPKGYLFSRRPTLEA